MNKIITITFLLFFCSYSIYSQKEQNIKTVQYKNPLLVKLKINEPVHLVDSLSILLKSFTYKRPYINGPTKETIHLALSKGNACGETEISIHGIDGKSKHTYTASFWQEYKIEFKGHEDDMSFKVVISKKDSEDLKR
ncbi:hypothetical protein [Aquimarina sp. MAR_2010_214]|uniref:hypothetical protein n=1 Tax=Aquimarina sp. MAR_2010_214 TaxID=1250026 RepID=UPI00117765C1|nr:hypothetical protein [Aquimarina sp. MAR_2010_214]